MNKLYLIFIALLALCACEEETPEPDLNIDSVDYRIADQMWEESLGSQRAVLDVGKPANAVLLELGWRRPDNNVADHEFIVINAATQERVPNISRLSVTRDHCQILFGPITEPGMYYFYYLPYQIVDGHGGYNKDYTHQEAAPAAGWVSDNIEQEKAAAPSATVLRIESRTAFDSFYPMEVIATGKEWSDYTLKYIDNYWVFPQGRENPIRMKSHVPYLWLELPPASPFIGEACQDEYYALQLGVVAGVDTLRDVRLEYSALRSDNDSISAKAFTCFNLEGVDPMGKPFTKQVNVAPAQVQPLWVGIDLPKNQRPGVYKGNITVSVNGADRKIVPVELTVKDSLIQERGDNEPWRHSRLRWLNSTRGIDDNPTAEYEKIKMSDLQMSVLGRQVQLSSATGLPSQIISWGSELLGSDITFTIHNATGVMQLAAKPRITEQKGGKIQWTWEASSDELTLSCLGTMEFDGWMNFQYNIKAHKALTITDVRLEIPFKEGAAPYVMGMGLEGQATPTSYSTKWDNPTGSLKPFDSFWMGSVYGGIHCELRGASYSGPLLNLYRPAPPQGWYNKNKGSLSFTNKNKRVTACVASGAFALAADQEQSFEWAFIITPVKAVDMPRQFTQRYYHNGGQPVPKEEDFQAGIKVVNIHHANYYNPFINYPFLSAGRLKDLVTDLHKKGCKVKMYYTIRELTNVVTEIWALRSLGYEILADGDGGGFPWLREHYVDNYYPQWYHHFPEGKGLDGVVADASVLTATGQTRWYNYYIEGLAWMIKHTDVDGLYLDDVAFDRNMMKRIRKVMAQVKPGCIIDLHSNTGFSKGPAIQYTEYFPYVDKIWFGESFQYSKMSPENWIVEVSGLPFGLMGDMLHAGGNKWLGMQYGMTVRHPWQTEGVICDPRLIWEEWDRFGIADSRMVGYWEPNPVAVTSDPLVKVTAYVKNGKTLLSIGNYAESDKEITLTLDWKQLNLNSQKATLKAPAIEGFQEETVFPVNATIPVKSKEGWLIEIY